MIRGISKQGTTKYIIVYNNTKTTFHPIDLDPGVELATGLDNVIVYNTKEERDDEFRLLTKIASTEEVESIIDITTTTKELLK